MTADRDGCATEAEAPSVSAAVTSISVHPDACISWRDGRVVIHGLSKYPLPPQVFASENKAVLSLLSRLAHPQPLEELLDGYDESSRATVQRLVALLLREGVLCTEGPPRARRLPRDLEAEPDFPRIYERCAPFLMGTSAPMAFALYQAVRHIAMRDIPGALVECGVWFGGNPLLMILTLQALGAGPRDIYLYDTFEATWPDPEAPDATLSGSSQQDLLANNQELHRRRAQEPEDGARAHAWDVEAVRQRLVDSGYPRERLHLVKGYVEDTLPAQAPGQVALLRLDTDFYRSTKHELVTLYPRLAPGGVLLVDDYPTHAGATQAVEEYFRELGQRIFLSRIDTQGRIGIKEADIASCPGR